MERINRDVELNSSRVVASVQPPITLHDVAAGWKLDIILYVNRLSIPLHELYLLPYVIHLVASMSSSEAAHSSNWALS